MLLAVMIAGCTPTSTPTASGSASSVVPSASPSPTCSPAGGTPRPCTQQEYDQTQEQNRLIEQAEAVYRAYWKENVRLYRSGGTSTATAVLKDTLVGQALDGVMKLYRQLKTRGSKAKGGTFDIVAVTPTPDVTKDGSAVSLDVCWRTKGVKLETGNTRAPVDATVLEASYYRISNGKLKIFAFASKQVGSC
ncbi:MAG: hypothetical protein QM582_14760 [Micropruina sp.]|uniref:hypothetical protein n=1 Tax=Micropruina sp. TaxID=2737536 RepID=UPI0039E6D050